MSEEIEDTVFRPESDTESETEGEKRLHQGTSNARAAFLRSLLLDAKVDLASVINDSTHVESNMNAKLKGIMRVLKKSLRCVAHLQQQLIEDRDVKRSTGAVKIDDLQSNNDANPDESVESVHELFKSATRTAATLREREIAPGLKTVVTVSLHDQLLEIAEEFDGQRELLQLDSIPDPTPIWMHTLGIYLSTSRSLALKFASCVEVLFDGAVHSLAFSAPQEAFQFAVQLQRVLVECDWHVKLISHEEWKPCRTAEGQLFKRGLLVPVGIAHDMLIYVANDSMEHSLSVGDFTHAKAEEVTFYGPALSDSRLLCSIAHEGETLASSKAIKQGQQWLTDPRSETAYECIGKRRLDRSGAKKVFRLTDAHCQRTYPKVVTGEGELVSLRPLGRYSVTCPLLSHCCSERVELAEESEDLATLGGNARRIIELDISPPPVNSAVCLLCVDLPVTKEMSSALAEEKLLTTILKVYSSIVYRLVKRHRCYMCSNLGDYYVFAFAEPVKALNFALSLSADMMANKWPLRLAEHYNVDILMKDIDVSQTRHLWKGVFPRIALHAAQKSVFNEDGSKIGESGRMQYGILQRVCEQLMKQAFPGQCLVTSTCVDWMMKNTNQFLSVPVMRNYSKLRLCSYEIDVIQVASKDQQHRTATHDALFGKLPVELRGLAYIGLTEYWKQCVEKRQSLLAEVEKRSVSLRQFFAEKRATIATIPKSNTLQSEPMLCCAVVDLPELRALWQAETVPLIYEELEVSSKLIATLVVKVAGAHGGIVVPSEGSTWFSTIFRNGVEAAAFAIELQLKALQLDWPEVICNRTHEEEKYGDVTLYRGPKLAIGVHLDSSWGTLCTAPTDVLVYGPCADVAERLARLASPGQSLITEAVYCLVTPESVNMEIPDMTRTSDVFIALDQPEVKSKVFNLTPSKLVLRKRDFSKFSLETVFESFIDRWWFHFRPSVVGAKKGPFLWATGAAEKISIVVEKPDSPRTAACGTPPKRKSKLINVKKARRTSLDNDHEANDAKTQTLMHNRTRQFGLFLQKYLDQFAQDPRGITRAEDEFIENWVACVSSPEDVPSQGVAHKMGVRQRFKDILLLALDDKSVDAYSESQPIRLVDSLCAHLSKSFARVHNGVANMLRKGIGASGASYVFHDALPVARAVRSVNVNTSENNERALEPVFIDTIPSTPIGATVGNTVAAIQRRRSMTDTNSRAKPTRRCSPGDLGRATAVRENTPSNSKKLAPLSSSLSVFPSSISR